MTEDSITRREGPVIEVALDDILDSVHARGWARGAWETDDGAGCLHQHIRWCQPVPGDAYLIEQVANRQGWGPEWNDVDGRTVDDLKGVLVDHRDITDQDLADTFGPQWEQIVALVRRSAVLTEDETARLGAARDAARALALGAARDAARDAAWGAAWGAARGAALDAALGAARDAARGAAWGAAWGAARDAARGAAWGAAWGAALDAARDAAWGAARAAWALVVRDLIGEHGITQAHYDTLTGPWRTVVGPVHPDDEVVA